VPDGCALAARSYRATRLTGCYACDWAQQIERKCSLFSAKQYRAKAAEMKFLLAVNERSPQETRELRNLEQTYTTLAENEEWMAINSDKTLQR
jgi:hypothetical protein